jgi:deoxyribodipyrimidine photo-lyase
LVIGDENPLRDAESRKDRLGRQLPAPFWTVDADVIVPSKLLAKEQFAARTIRPRLHALLPRFLQAVENPSPKVPWPAASQLISEHNLSLTSDFPIDRSVSGSKCFHGGPAMARRGLAEFIESRLSGYATARNKPDLHGTSQLSPCLHFGDIGPHTINGGERGGRAGTGPQCVSRRVDRAQGAGN